MLGLGLLIGVFGAVTAWSGWNDINPVAVIDAVIGQKPLPAHKPHAGFDRVATFLAAYLALRVAAAASGGLSGILGGAAAGGAAAAAGRGKGEVPIEIPAIVP